MRYVQVWFTCSWKGCEAKEELLIECRQITVGNRMVSVIRNLLPEGWGSQGEPTEEYGDHENTFCPAHRWRD